MPNALVYKLRLVLCLHCCSVYIIALFTFGAHYYRGRLALGAQEGVRGMPNAFVHVELERDDVWEVRWWGQANSITDLHTHTNLHALAVTHKHTSTRTDTCMHPWM